jgi:cytochrome bd-type quinol oxidase subunit 2
MNNTTNNQNVLPQIKTPKIFIPIILLILVLVISIFLIMYKVNVEGGASKEEITKNIFIILFVGLIILSLCIGLLPIFKDIKTLFEQISNVTYVILYTIFLILFFRMVPSNIINDYAFIILPVTIIIGAIMFYKSASYSYIDVFDVNYERLKMMIMMFCLITIFIIYYNKDPGGYISKYFGYSLLLTILIAVFAFLYLIIVITLPDKVLQPEPGAKSSNFLNNFTGISAYGSIAFLLFLIGITIAITTYPGGFFTNDNMAASVIILTLVVCILFSILLGANLFSSATNNGLASSKLNIFKKSLLTLFGIVISGLIIAWLVFNIQGYSENSNLTTFILNIVLVILVLGLIYKIIIVKLPVANSNKNAFFMLILNTLFYIPCFFSGIFDNIGGFLFSNFNRETSGNLIMLLVTICIIIAYFKFPSLFNRINTQGGKQLVNQPVHLDSLNSLGTYQELNDSENYDYQYALSFWFYIDSSPNNLTPSDSNFSILNYANKPNVFYSTKTQSLVITMDQKNLEKTTNNKLIDFDEDGNRILYRNKNILLQRWNNMILNYNGGILDIFLNGELVKSNIGVVPYYTLDNLTIGQDNGLKGGICNVVYFRYPLNSLNLYFIYNVVKNHNPPVADTTSSKTILKENINTATSSIVKVT